MVNSKVTPLGHQLPDDVPHAQPAGRVEPGGRLVEEQHRGAGHHAGGQVEPAAHPARIALHDPVGGVGQLEPVEQLGRPGPWRRCGPSG